MHLVSLESLGFRNLIDILRIIAIGHYIQLYLSEPGQLKCDVAQGASHTRIVKQTSG